MITRYFFCVWNFIALFTDIFCLVWKEPIVISLFVGEDKKKEWIVHVAELIFQLGWWANQTM